MSFMQANISKLSKSLQLFTRRLHWALACALSIILLNSVGFAASFEHQGVSDKHILSARQATQNSEATPKKVAAKDLQRNKMTLPKSQDVAWRIRFVEAAISTGEVVTVGDIAIPAGDIPPELWQKLARLELWEAPPLNGRPMNMSRPRLQQAVLESMGADFARLCLYPSSMVIQQGGQVFNAAAVQELTVKTLTPFLAELPGEVSLGDFRLPSYVFLEHAGQRLELELPARPTAGRMNLRYVVKEVDGAPLRRLTGSLFVDCWALVPCAASSLNKDEIIVPAHINFIKQNLAYLREEVWDGKSGGPWRLTRAISLGQAILISDLNYVPTVTKGSIVSLVYAGSAVRLSVKAEALADGVKGETIPVRNLASKKQVYGMVWDNGIVLIENKLNRVAFSE